MGGVSTTQSIEMASVAVGRLTLSTRGKPVRFLESSLPAAGNCQNAAFCLFVMFPVDVGLEIVLANT